MSWTLRYTSHLGYAPPDVPLFRDSVNNVDLVAHIDYAADLGLAGILYPWAVSRSAAERDAVAGAIAERKLECSCIVYAPFEAIQVPLWVDASAQAKRQLEQQIRVAASVARSLHSKMVAVLIKGDNTRDAAEQRACAIDKLRALAPIAMDHGVLLGVEPMIALPDMLLKNVVETRDVIGEVDSPAVRMIFDTGHVQMMDGDVVNRFIECVDQIGLIQLADQPGRVEPGAGEIDFDPILLHAVRQGYTGLVDLEHGWLNATAAGEEEGLRRIRKLDMRVRASLSDGPAAAT